MAVFQAVSWHADDVDDAYTIRVFGRCADGRSACVTTTFDPYFYVRVPDGVNHLAYLSRIREKCNRRGKLIKSARVGSAKDLWGFQNGREHAFIQLSFASLKNMRISDYLLRDNYNLYESNLEPVLRFMHRSGVESTGWLDAGKRCAPGHESTCDLDLVQSDWRAIKPVRDPNNAPLVVGSFDIECYSATGGFPDPNDPPNVAFQIAITTRVLGEETYRDKVCLCLKRHDTDSAYGDIRWFETERDLISNFSRLVRTLDVDILTGWNISGFDLEYLATRAVLTGADMRLSRLANHECELVVKKLSSSALGDNVMKLLPMPGRFVFDLFRDVKREKKLESYSLNFVAKTYLGDQKLDMPAREIFRRYAEGSPTELREVADYCIKDTMLPHAIMAKLNTLPNLLEMAKATWVPLSYLAERGQQIKVFSQITYKARSLGFMVPKLKHDRGAQQDYKGATVLDAQKGAYYRPITALDFASLYPSIMVAHNLCYASLVMDPAYDDLPGVTYEDFRVGDRTYRFAQNVPTLLPTVLNELKAFRKQAKRDMAAARGTPLEAVYDGKQLAYKVSMNSVYGFTGAATGMLPCVAIASSVTCQGRAMIDETKAYVESNVPGSFVRYGDTDSVMVEFDVGDLEGQAAIDASWAMGERAAAECTKLFKAPNDLELEKVYCPFFLYSKKRYAAKMWVERDGAVVFDHVDIKGLQVVRRDNAPYVRDACRDLFDIILDSPNVDGAIAHARKCATDLIEGRVSMDRLTLSKSLSGSYKVDGERWTLAMLDDDAKKLPAQPHVHVVKKIRDRAPGSEPQSGDRVPFVVTRIGDKMCEKAEDPAWAREHDVMLDYHYYFENQLRNPVCDLLEPLTGDADVFANVAKRVARMKTDVRGLNLRKKLGCRDIADIFAAYNKSVAPP